MMFVMNWGFINTLNQNELFDFLIVLNIWTTIITAVQHADKIHAYMEGVEDYILPQNTVINENWYQQSPQSNFF